MFVLGPLHGIKMTDLTKILLEEYGPIVKLTGLGRNDLIMLSDPDDAEKVKLMIN